MAALVTQVPVPVPVPVNPTIDFGFDGFAGGDNYIGPIAFGGKLFLPLTAGFNTTSTSMFMSADNGATWAPQDDANAPLAPGRTLIACAVLVGSIIHVAIFAGGGTTAQVKTFNCSTLTWGASSVSTSTGTISGGALIVQPNGDRFLFYNKTAGGIFVRILSGGVWSAATTVVAAITNAMQGVQLDASGVSHVFYFTSGGASNKMLHIPVDSAGVVGASTTIATLTTLISYTRAWTTVTYSPTIGVGGSYFMGYPYPSIVVLGQVPQVAIGSPTLGWTTTSPDPTGISIPAGSTAYFQGTLATLTNGKVMALWLVYDPATALVDALWGSVYDGTAWSTPVLVYDSVANPPAAATPPSIITPQFVGGVNLAQLPDGSFGLGFTMDTTLMGFGASRTEFFARFFLGPTVPGSQLVFYGVRRTRTGKTQAEQRAARLAESGKYFEEVCQYPFTFSLPTAYNAALPLLAQQGTRYKVVIQDEDFELRHIIKSATDGAGAAITIPSVFAMILYDQFYVARMNAPVLAEFLCDDVSAPNGRNFWPAPPILYKINASIPFDIFNMVDASVVLPVTVRLVFDGVKRFLCN